MLASSFAVVAGAESADSAKREYTYKTGNGKSLLKSDKDEGYLYKTGEYTVGDKTLTIMTADDKLSLMDYRYGTDDFELYVDAYSGEVAVRSIATGDVMFSNPYTVGSSNATSSVKEELLSQIIVHFTDVATKSEGTYNSYTWAAKRDQITVKNIKGGIRVEYAIGREETRSLLPRLIEESKLLEMFETIEANIEAAIAEGKVEKPSNERHRLTQFKAYYEAKITLKGATLEERARLIEKYPALETYEKLAKTDPKYENFTMRVFDVDAGDVAINKQELLIKDYYPDFTFQDLDDIHNYVEYEAETEVSPLFKLALEYTLEDTGLVVRLPANGVRFNETYYQLDNIEILPYMGAGMNPNSGYTFFPDGSGTLFDFEDIAILESRKVVTGQIYGQDFAYHGYVSDGESDSMVRNEEIIRYPVFGIYEEETIKEPVIDRDGNVKYDEEGNVVTTSRTQDRGFVAIVEEGDSLMKLSVDHDGGQRCEYNTVRMSVYPRPTDSYNVADAISVGENSEWTVVSSRKYTGNYKVRYIMLTDDDVAQRSGVKEYYQTSYVGMAKAYRDYLEDNGMITRLRSTDVDEDIPLYIETFGALETTERFLSIPINVMTPLTSFGDIKTMYEDLKGNDITNVNFIMTGYTKGGLSSPTVPYNLKWESSVSKEMDFDELTEYAKDEGFGLFPDFDFVFASENKMFDGLSYLKHASRTIDNRYASKREYSATKHTYVSYFELALSPAYFYRFYEKFIPKYQKHDPIGISVSTLGSYLNSDFDEDEPYNRADGQKYTVDAFEYIDSTLSDTEVMTSGGNAYSWKYVDHLTDIALDSSRYAVSSASVPFLGIVLHGYVELAGTPINMEGNLDYAFLKALESGAAFKYILSYRNTENLKEDEILNTYYSVNYDIWYDNGNGDLVTMYKELNELLKGVQTSVIVDHRFLDGTRVPDDDEIEADALEELANAIAYEEALANADSEAERESIAAAEQLIAKGTAAVNTAVDETVKGSLAYQFKALKAIRAEYDVLVGEANAKIDAYIACIEAADLDAAKLAKAEAEKAVKAVEEKLEQIYAAATVLKDDAYYIVKYYSVNKIRAAYELLEAKGAFSDSKREALKDIAYSEVYEENFDIVKDLRTGYKAMADAEAKDTYSLYSGMLTKLTDFEAVNETAASKDYKLSDVFAGEAFKYTKKQYTTDADETVITKAEINTEKYDSDANMIVYEKYDNGTEFLINFNDYRVVVNFNETSYSIDAYGYVVLTRAKS